MFAIFAFKIRKELLETIFFLTLLDITQKCYSTEYPVLWRLTGSKIHSRNVIEICSTALLVDWT